MRYQLGYRDNKRIWRDLNPRLTAPEAGTLSAELQILKVLEKEPTFLVSYPPFLKKTNSSFPFSK